MLAAELGLDPAVAAGDLADLGPAITTESMSEALADFSFPDEWWSRLIYDAILAACSDRDQLDPPVRDVLRLGVSPAARAADVTPSTRPSA